MFKYNEGQLLGDLYIVENHVVIDERRNGKRMFKYKLIEYQDKYFDRWNSFVERANGGTIFHRLDFLDYHGFKFKENENHLIFLKGEELFGIMPMAVFEKTNKKIAKSPYGASYGGPVFLNPLNYADSFEIVKLIRGYIKSNRIDEISITFPIAPCYKIYSDTFKFALIEQGFKIIKRDVSSLVYLETEDSLEQMFTSRARNKARKARKLGINIKNKTNFDDIWNVLEKTFFKHGVKPTHAKDELFWLYKKMPNKIYFDIAYFEKKPIACVCFFVINSKVNSTFYLAQNLEDQQKQGLSLLIYEAILRCKREGYIWLDFGTSTINMRAKENIFRFKEGFGAIGYFRETYKLASSDL